MMPLITSGNANSPTLMIAERAAKWILKRPSHEPQDIDEGTDQTYYANLLGIFTRAS